MFNSHGELSSRDSRLLRHDILMFATCSSTYYDDEVGGFSIAFEHHYEV